MVYVKEVGGRMVSDRVAYVIFAGVILIMMVWAGFSLHSDQIEIECLNEKAVDYCTDKGMILVRMNNPTYFTCGENSRTVMEDGERFKFTKAEKNECK